MKEVIFQGTDLVKTFGETKVLQGVSLELYKGDFTVIMGSSGSGKSTLLYMLGGMDRLSGGQLLYYNRKIDMTHASEKQLTSLRAEEFGFVFQRTHLVSSLTLEENIRMAGLIAGSMSEREIAEKTETLIRQMHLEKAKDRLPAQVSGGEAQRAAVARAVITKPAMLFADEPTGALNKANTEEVLNLLTVLHTEGQTILLVTHDREAALRGNRILYLEDGAIVGELKLSPYQGKDIKREQELASWLEGFRW
ncbi:MAG: ABC transporter ATP-binding protein [Lachnospiraceae bacterium]|nr:ABC transporter ATP-binding protein [Lachnospiraceae bacterium]